MLWRAGSGHRQLLSLYFHSKPRWTITFANTNFAALSCSSRTGRESLPSPKTFKFTGKIPRSLLSRFTIETSSLLVTIEQMSLTDIGKDEILQRLKTMPADFLQNSKTVCAFAREMAEKSCPERAAHVLHISHRLGIVLAHNQYEQVVYELITRSYWSHAYNIATMAERHTGRWTTRLLNWVISSHLGMQQYDLLDGVLDLFERDRISPSRKTYHHLVRGHLQNADLARARDCLARMRDAGFEMNKSTYLTVLGAYRSLGSNEAVEEQAFQTIQGIGDQSDTIILNALMQLRIDDRDLAGALRILGLFSLTPITGRGNDGDGVVRASTNSSPSTTSKPPPDNATFNMLLAFLSRQKDTLPNVLRVFAHISAAGLHVDAEAVAALVRAHFKANMSGAAIAMVAEMCKFHNLSVDPGEFRQLGCRADLLGHEVLHTRSVFPTIHIFNVVLQGVLVEHGLLGMRRVLRIMRQAAFTPDAETTQIIISYLYSVKDMRPRSLIRVLRALAALRSDQASITVRHTNTILLSALRRERDIVRSKSWNATAQRVRFGHRPRFSTERLFTPAQTFDPTAGIALTSFRHSVRKLLEPVIQSLVDKQVMSDSRTFTLSIKRNAVIKMDMDSAWSVFNVMVARGIRPDAYHFSALMEGHAAKGEMDKAREVMDRAARSGVAPNVVMHTILIIGHGRMGRPDLAMGAFRDMKSAGVEPDFAAIDSVVSAYWFAREYRTARNTLLELWPLVAPFPPDLAEASLRVLIQSFRALRTDPRVIRTSDSPRDRSHRLLVKREWARTFAELKKGEPMLTFDSLSWAKEHVPLNPMLRRDVSEGFDDF